jgi:hypothetical protein
MADRNWKMVLFWVLGAVCMMMGSIISGRLESGTGVTGSSYLLAFSFSFILFLLGGLLWISVAIAMKRKLD